MSVNEIKLSISKIIEQIDDPTLLEAYYKILKNVLKVHQSAHLLKPNRLHRTHPRNQIRWNYQHQNRQQQRPQIQK